MESPNAPSVSASAWASNSFTTPSCQRPAANPGGPLAFPGTLPRRHRIGNRHPRQTPPQPFSRQHNPNPSLRRHPLVPTSNPALPARRRTCRPPTARPPSPTTALPARCHHDFIRREATDSGQNFDLIDAISSRSVERRVRTLTSPPTVEFADPPNPSSPNTAPDP